MPASTYPLIPGERIAMRYAQEIHIGNNVWIAFNVVVCGGVKVGGNAIIGAESVVTKDIPENYLAYGPPCKPVRPITEKDSRLNFL